jgi:hypothetical protein
LIERVGMLSPTLGDAAKHNLSIFAGTVIVVKRLGPRAKSLTTLSSPPVGKPCYNGPCSADIISTAQLEGEPLGEFVMKIVVIGVARLGPTRFADWLSHPLP